MDSRVPLTLFEIQSLTACHEVVLDAYGNGRQLDEGFALEVHRTLTQGAYYGAMEAWDAERDLDPLRLFLKVEGVRTWGKLP